MKTKIIAGLVAVAIYSAQGALFTFGPYPNGGETIPQDGFQLRNPETIRGLADSITSFTLALTFNNTEALANDGSGIQGELVLGGGVNASFVSFNPVATTTSGANAIYDVTFSDLPGNPGNGFNGLNPNDTWTLELLDNNTTYGNALFGWSLDITAVPEPVNLAMGLFGAVFAIGTTMKSFCHWKSRFTNH